jgi:hypothetical protein
MTVKIINSKLPAVWNAQGMKDVLFFFNLLFHGRGNPHLEVRLMISVC